MVVMKDAVANLLLKLSSFLRSGDEDRRWKIEDGNQTNKPSSIPAATAMAAGGGAPPPYLKITTAEAQVDAMLTANPVWGADEAKAIAVFLNSPAGQLFSKRIRSVAAHVAIEGSRTGGTRRATTANTIHSAGVSAGWNECVRYIHSLATCQCALSRVSGEQDTSQVGCSNLNDRHQPEGEAEMLERLSP
jgi:hypothetical protein